MLHWELITTEFGLLYSLCKWSHHIVIENTKLRQTSVECGYIVAVCGPLHVVASK